LGSYKNLVNKIEKWGGKNSKLTGLSFLNRQFIGFLFYPIFKAKLNSGTLQFFNSFDLFKSNFVFFGLNGENKGQVRTSYIENMRDFSENYIFKNCFYRNRIALVVVSNQTNFIQILRTLIWSKQKKKNPEDNESIFIRDI